MKEQLSHTSETPIYESYNETPEYEDEEELHSESELAWLNLANENYAKMKDTVSLSRQFLSPVMSKEVIMAIETVYPTVDGREYFRDKYSDNQAFFDNAINDAVKDAAGGSTNDAANNISGTINSVSNSEISEAREFKEDKAEIVSFCKEVYEVLMRENPELRNIRLSSSDTPYYLPESQDTHEEVICLNFDNIGDTQKSVDKERYSYFDALKAMRLGVDIGRHDSVGYAKLSAAFTMLHEFGHSYDFYKNHIDRILKTDGPILAGMQNRGRCKDPLGGIASRAAIDFNSERKEQVLSTRQFGLEIINKLSDDGFTNFVTDYYYGIDNNTIIDLENSYRSMPQEAYADSFAADFISKHADLFFVDGDSVSDEELAKDKRVLRFKSERFEIPESEYLNLDLLPGMSIQVSECDKDGNLVVRNSDGNMVPGGYSAWHTSRLKSVIEPRGKTACFGKSSKSKLFDPDFELFCFDKIQMITDVSEDGSVDNKLIFQLPDGRYMRIRHTPGEKGIKESPLTSEEFSEFTNTGYGAEIHLVRVKSEHHEKESITLGEAFNGILLPVDVDNEKIKHYQGIKIGEEIDIVYLDENEERVDAELGVVTGFSEKFGRYFITTADATYEVLKLQGERESAEAQAS